MQCPNWIKKLFNITSFTPEKRDEKAVNEFDSLLIHAAQVLGTDADTLTDEFLASVDGGHFKAWLDSSPLGESLDPTEYGAYIWKGKDKQPKEVPTQHERILEDFKRYFEKRKNPESPADLEL